MPFGSEDSDMLYCCYEQYSKSCKDPQGPDEYTWDEPPKCSNKGQDLDVEAEDPGTTQEPPPEVVSVKVE
jgi:hypothetical protein